MQNQETRVRFGLKYTKNLGNYESISVDVSVDDYVKTGEKTSEAYKRISDFVEARLEEKLLEIQRDL